MSRKTATTKRGLGRILASAVAIFACLTLIAPVAAFADGEPASTVDAEESVSVTIGNDVMWAGDVYTADGVEIPNDLLCAGSTITVSNSEIPGSVRLACETATVSDCQVGQSITIAGQNIAVSNTTCAGAAIAGQDISFSGEAGNLIIAGESVYLDGVINGDAHIYAENVELGPNAVITGTLTVVSNNEPVIDGAAQCGNVVVEKPETSSFGLVSGIATGSVALGAVLGIIRIIAEMLCIFLMAVLCEWLARRSTAGAASMIKQRTGATIGTGIIGAIVLPIVCVVLLLPVVTIPVSIALFAGGLGISVVCTGFAAASLPKLISPKAGRFKAAMLGGLIAAIVTRIPVIGGIVVVCCFMYMLGYILQRIFLGLKKEPAAPAAPAA